MGTIVGLLQEAQRRFGTRTALVMRQGYRTRRWSYQQLWAWSGKVAACLQRQGVNKGDRVILWAPNSPHWVAVFFGCLRVGGIVVPLDLRSPPELVQRVAERTQPKLAFLSRSRGANTGHPDDLGTAVIWLEDLESLLDVVDSTAEEMAIGPDDIAEVIFTSGTTGDPKGVILTHRNIVANVQAATQVVPSKPSYRLLSLLPLSHMLEQTVGLLSPITGGASIYYPQSRQSTAVFRAFKEQRITTLVLVPQALQLFMNAIEGRVKAQGQERTWYRLHRLAPSLPLPLRRKLFGPVHRQLGGSLCFIICGGAYLDPALAGKWEALGIPVLQGYGATETAPIISCNTFQGRKLDSVGRPLPGVTVRLAEDGEILVRGDNVTPGYWQNPQATEAAFQEGWYSTGDLGSLDKKGFLYFKGRKKDLIVLSSGLNVYPEDVETLLQNHPDVADAVVIGLPGQGQEVQVHAVLLLKDGTGNASMVVEQVNSRLAEHQRIQGFTVWPEADFPRTHTLKVKKHLVLESLVRAQAGGQIAPAASSPAITDVPPLVRLLAQAAQRPAEQITPSMHLGTDLGLDSLGRVELLAAIETEPGVYLDESQVSEATTVEELKAMVARADQAPQRAEYWEWPLNWSVRLGRAALQSFLVFPLMHLVAPLKGEDKGQLKGLPGPVLFAANHLSHLDSPVVLAALPRRWRFHTAVAAAADVWFTAGRFKSVLAALLFNAFPFSRADSIRPSLEHCSRLLERGWSVLIYPEGTRSGTGQMGPFKSGTGLMAVELGVPVVPVHIQGTFEVMPKDQKVLRRGRVRVRFGQPLQFATRTSYAEATRAIEEAVRGLSRREERVYHAPTH